MSDLLKQRRDLTWPKKKCASLRPLATATRRLKELLPYLTPAALRICVGNSQTPPSVLI